MQVSFSPYLSESFAKGLLEEKSSNDSTERRGDRSVYSQETCPKYAGSFAGIVTLLYFFWNFASLNEMGMFSLYSNPE